LKNWQIFQKLRLQRCMLAVQDTIWHIRKVFIKFSVFLVLNWVVVFQYIYNNKYSGVNNAFLINTRDDLAIIYNGKHIYFQKLIYFL
jgi:hypothetical protein